MIQLSPAIRRALFVTVAWLGVTVFFVGQNVINNVMYDRPPDWVRAFVFELLYWIPWMVATPLLLLVARKMPLAGPKWPLHLSGHLAFVAVFGLVQSILYLWSRKWTAVVLFDWSAANAQRLSDPLGPSLPYMWLTAFYKYWLFLGVYYSFSYYRKYRERELAAAQLKGQLTAAKLQSLELQLQPHFLFNSLHTVSMLTLENPSGANQVLAQLSGLLRETLESKDPIVSLDLEMAFLGRYVAIESVRFGDRLQVSYQVSDEARKVAVPRLLLLPLVENAVRHGVSARSEAGRITVRADVVNGFLRVSVEDDGPGYRNGGTSGTGLGLRLTRERLERLYPGQHSVTVSGATPTGTIVTISIPASPVEISR